MSNPVFDAAQTLGLKESATLNDINEKYKQLLFKWHPDHSTEDPEKSKAMTEKIVQSYKIILTYCNNYKFSFIEKDIENSNTWEDPEAFWERRFGPDGTETY